MAAMLRQLLERACVHCGTMHAMRLHFIVAPAPPPISYQRQTSAEAHHQLLTCFWVDHAYEVIVFLLILLLLLLLLLGLL